MRAITSKMAILSMLYSILHKSNRTYCWPTLATIQKNLLKHHSIDIRIRTISKHLQQLRFNGYIKSFRRYGRKIDGTYYNKPSNRQLTRKAFAELTKVGVKIARWLWDWALKGVLPFRSKSPIVDLPPQDPDSRTGSGPLKFPSMENAELAAHIL
ncbi:MAG: hypothetical protein E3J94_02800 [Desulfobacteraceae bacterium]|nr:MAG: hypothetical protein E3J94_02800 [Desulfobacteraceae bacterium]